tara:strand:+ start:176 stop:1624 length:1449 start_codon:yes stop_codon:yes gene_type:complete
MAADQSLISASLKEAQSRVGPDKTKFYESNVNRISNTMESISNVFKQKALNTAKAWEEVAGNTEKMMNSLASEDKLGNMGQANIDHLKSLKQEFLSAGNNKDEQNKVKIKIEKVVKTINKLAAGFGKYGEAYVNDTLDRDVSDPGFTNILGRIWEEDGVYDDTQFNWTENGDLEIIVDGEATNSNVLFDKLVLKNSAPLNAMGVLGDKALNDGFKNIPFDRAGNVEKVKELFSGAEGKNKLATTIASSTFGNESFIQALVNNKSIHKTLQDLKKFDNNNDGKVTTADFATDENKQKLIDALTNIHSDSFDFETAKQVAAEWYTDSYLQSKNVDGVNARNNSRGGGVDENNQKIVKQFEEGNAVISLQNGTSAVKQENGRYVIAHDSNLSIYPSNSDTFSASDLIVAYGGTASSKRIDKLKLNLDVKEFNGVDITNTTYTVVGDVAYTKEDFMKKVNNRSLTQQEIVEGGRNQVELQNSRGKQ